jgi:hypothetical protein
MTPTLPTCQVTTCGAYASQNPPLVAVNPADLCYVDPGPPTCATVTPVPPTATPLTPPTATPTITPTTPPTSLCITDFNLGGLCPELEVAWTNPSGSGQVGIYGDETCSTPIRKVNGNGYPAASSDNAPDDQDPRTGYFRSQGWCHPNPFGGVWLKISDGSQTLCIAATSGAAPDSWATSCPPPTPAPFATPGPCSPECAPGSTCVYRREVGSFCVPCDAWTNALCYNTSCFDFCNNPAAQCDYTGAGECVRLPLPPAGCPDQQPKKDVCMTRCNCYAPN